MQFELPGRLALADGRYLLRDGEGNGGERVLVVETLSAPAPPRRRRRRAKPAEVAEERAPLPLSRVTVVRASEPFDSEQTAERWLRGATEAEAADTHVEAAVSLIGRALHIEAVTSADPHVCEPTATQAAALRIGYGSGEEVAAGRFTRAFEVEAPAKQASGRQQRAAELRTQGRVAAVLGGRERLDACETLLLRARADLDAGRMREAALQLRGGLEALLVELQDALPDPDHQKDMAELADRRAEASTASEAALRGELADEYQHMVRELIEICERVLRRRRVLGG